MSSIDSRLYEVMQQTGSKVKPNFRYQTALSGDVLKTESVDAGSTCLLKDALGRPMICRNAEGVITGWHYEPEGAGRLLSVSEKAGEGEKIIERFVYAENTSENRAYNLVGSLITHYDTAGVKCTKSISLNGIMLSVTQQLLNDDEESNWKAKEPSKKKTLSNAIYHTATTVDTIGAVLTQTDSKGNVQRNTYDIAGMLKKSTLTLKGESTATDLFKKVTYSASGQKQQEVHGNGVISTYTYEAETQRLTGLKVERPSTHPKGAKVFQDLHYTYDPVGNVLSVENKAEAMHFFRNKKIAPKNTYRYDTLYQLVTATGREMVSNSGTQITLPEPVCPLSDNTQYSSYTRDYAYERGGNLIQIRHHAPESQKSHTTDILISNKSNHAVLKTVGLLPEQIDNLFHLGGHQKALSKGQALSWTQRGELARVKITDADTETYRYDADSQRVTKMTTSQHSGSTHTEKVIYLGNLEIRTRHQDGKLKEELHRINAGNIQFLHWETGKPTEIENNQQRHSHGDIINSRGLELDHNGELISQEEYYPYGGTSIWTARSKTEADYKTIRYSGKERDATGLYYYGYRYYQSWLGRWLSADPAGTIDGLNLYRMVRNNPVRLFDAYGLAPEPNLRKSAKSNEDKKLKIFDYPSNPEELGIDCLDFFSGEPIKKSSIDTKRWMKLLPDSTHITDIYYPGTHDSGATIGDGMAICQSGSILDQLNVGIRVLDIRAKAGKSGALSVYHGPIDQNLSLDQVVKDITDFLTENPSEFVFLKLKQESGKDKNFSKLFNENYYEKNLPIFYQKTGNLSHTLGEVRGKIMMIKEDPLIQGLNWNDKNLFDKQSSWKILSGDADKKKNVSKHIC